jgi:hypothetical protein
MDISLPSNQDFERALLSCCLRNAALLTEPTITENLLNYPSHRKLLAVLRAMRAEGAQLEFVAVKNRCHKLGLLDEFGDTLSQPSYLDEIFRCLDTASNWKYYRDGLGDISAARLALLQTQKLQSDITDSFGPPSGNDIATSLSEITAKVRSLCQPKEIFPSWYNAMEVPAEQLVKPEALIEGLFHRGHKMVIGGGSKTYKTWMLTDLGLSLALGSHWLGFKCRPARVLYINLEIQTPFYMERVNAIDSVKFDRALAQPTNFYFWTLRGYAKSIEEIIPEIIKRVRQQGVYFDVIIWDPIYKVYGNRQENVASEMAELMNELDHLSVELSVSNIFGAHYSKGNQSSKEAIDRIAGSGVFGRDPDTIITLTANNASEHAFSVDFILRNNPEVNPFGVSWAYPLLVRDSSIDPADLKAPGGRKLKATLDEIVELIGSYDDELNTVALEKKASDEFGLSRATFHRYLGKLKKQKLIRRSAITDNWCVC